MFFKSFIFMVGPVVNALVIVVCGLLGVFLVKGIPGRFEVILKKALALALVFIGLKGAFDNQHPLLLILSLVIGACLGEALNIDLWFRRLGDWAESKMPARKAGEESGAVKRGDFSKSFVQASILFCSGSMAIVGSMQSGLTGNNETLFAKSILDGSFSIVFGATLGIGTVFSAVPVLLYQGGIALLAMLAQSVLTPDMISESSAAGSLLICAIGFNFLEIKEIKVANLIPAVFIPFVYFAFANLV